MGLSIVNLVVMGIGTGLLIIFLITFLLSLRHKELFDVFTKLL